jgi:uncharacterized protein (TIGR02118 family)
MSVSYFVRYEGTSRDVAAFLRHYREKHVPILARWPGLQRVVLHTPVQSTDPFAVNRGGAALLAQLEFPSVEALNAALAGAERAEARKDFQQFPKFEGTVVHQAMRAEEIWRSPWLDGNEEQA